MCGFCDDTDDKIIEHVENRGIFAQLTYYSKEKALNISGGVGMVEDLQTEKTFNIRYCPMCGKKL